MRNSRPLLKLVKPGVPLKKRLPLEGLQDKIDNPAYPQESRALWAAILAKDESGVKQALDVLRNSQP